MGAVKTYRLEVFQTHPDEDMTLYLKQMLAKMTNGNLNGIEKLTVDYKKELYKFCSQIIGMAEANSVFATKAEAEVTGVLLGTMYRRALGLIGKEVADVDVQIGKNPDGDGYVLACVAV